MKKNIVKFVSKISLNQIRGQALLYGQPSLLWWWSPWTKRFAHGGWIYLNLSWFWRFRNGTKSAK